MDSAAVKESRQVLRKVQDHLYLAHENLGVQRNTVGLVDVMLHPSSALPSLNYVTPRRNTAWVSGSMIEQGLTHMREANRILRVRYIEGLYPPPFAKTLRELGLQTEWELPLMVYLKDGFNRRPSVPVTLETLPDGVTVEAVSDRRGVQVWLAVWRQAVYDVASLGVEPLYAGPDLSALESGKQIDVLLTQADKTVGIARLSIQDDVGHLLAIALLKEVHAPELARLLQVAAVDAALKQGCTMVYASGEKDTDRQIARSLGFLDFGSIVGYVASQVESDEVRDDHILGQPVFALR